MPSLDELESGLARLTIAYKSISVTVEYYPERVGIALQRATASVQRPPYDMGPIADELAKVLAAWDITRGNEPVPITADGIGSLGMRLASEIASAIMQDFHDPKSPRSLTTAPSAPSEPSTPSPPGWKPDVSVSVPSGPTSSSEPNGPGSIRPISPGSLTPVAPSSGAAGSGP